MNDNFNHAKAIFLEAVEKYSPDQWAAYLDQACHGQTELRRRVEVLLEAHRETGTAHHQVAKSLPLVEKPRPGLMAIFDQVLDIASVEREAYLAAACAGQSEL